MAYERVPGPFDCIDLATCIDDTLPPGHVKFLHGGEQASVFKLDLETEQGELVATWQEKHVVPRSRRLS